MNYSGDFLSPRLAMIASLVPQSNVVCDIGTDHGYIPIYLIKSGKSKKVIAADINSGPLNNARENIIESGVIEHIELRLSDGFSQISRGEAETAVIAGMGGELISKILAKDVGVHNFILQPQSKFAELRTFLCENNYSVQKERVCRDGDKMYTAMLCVRKPSKKMTKLELEIGSVLLEERPDGFFDYVRYRLNEVNLILNKIGNYETAPDKFSEYKFLKNEYEKILKELVYYDA